MSPVETRFHVVQLRARSIRFGYEMRHAGSGRMLATGSTNHIVCGPNRRPVRLPEKYRRYFSIA